MEALVNTVNTVGIMGKGIALQFRQAFPDNYAAYHHACLQGVVTLGRMFVTRPNGLTNPRFIVNFPTKRDWRSKSRVEDIEAGLADLVTVLKQHSIKSVALPPLGCGNGGLDWQTVKPIILHALEAVADVETHLYEPDGAPAPASMRVRTKSPAMTMFNAVVISLLRQYLFPGYSASRLEVQKLAYLMQNAGESLRLTFIKAERGPYADALRHPLQRMEGHFLRGYGDQSGESEIRVLPDAAQEADLLLEDYPDTRTRLDKVFTLIESFETPYGLELLSTVHWLAQENRSVHEDVGLAVQGVRDWNLRKQELFSSGHIEVAWERLKEQGWI